MAYNIISVSPQKFIWTVQVPLPDNAITKIVAELAQAQLDKCQNVIIVDATQIDPAHWDRMIVMLLNLLRSISPYGSVTLVGLPYAIEQLLRHSVAGDPKLTLHFAPTIQDAHNFIQSLETDLPAASVYSNNQSFDLRNNQTKILFEAFLANQNRLYEWRNMIDSLYDSEAIEFETIMFVKQHGLGDADDMAIDWFRLITALLNETDP
jgi:hypothetical protein